MAVSKLGFTRISRGSGSEENLYLSALEGVKIDSDFHKESNAPENVYVEYTNGKFRPISDLNTDELKLIIHDYNKEAVDNYITTTYRTADEMRNIVARLLSDDTEGMERVRLANWTSLALAGYDYHDYSPDIAYRAKRLFELAEDYNALSGQINKNYDDTIQEIWDLAFKKNYSLNKALKKLEEEFENAGIKVPDKNSKASIKDKQQVSKKRTNYAKKLKKNITR